MFDLNELKDKIAFIGICNTKYGNFPEIHDYGLPRRGEQSEFAHGAPVKVVFDAVTDDVTPSKFALV
jgi:hypothetical protein